MEDIFFFLFLWRIRLDGVYMYRDFVATIIFTININFVLGVNRIIGWIFLSGIEFAKFITEL